MMVLRAARSTDAGAVGGILTEFSATTEWMPKLHSGAEDIAHAGAMIKRGWVTVAEASGEVIGFAACDGADLDALYVAGVMRGQGVGTALLQHMMVQHDRLSLWTFQTNEGAQRFYLRHGFTEVQRTDGATTDEKLPDVRFEWQRKGA
ncbi:GNAT family N-acetyltransferase [Sulfitobacter mediterraneus]|uniref:GNAT family N-acetyltransferase n=1 Tax=Sulfitobacter mediterraneus TaxID=83219 RepID=UPI0019333878|nr:GNAT family N-acetyltransferase [Sulfitobacter mediterraneus]MBM1310381.1 GNAT family N-acetyltransferase [Sulfitobacter mediterraneus]MBM1314265.1 GNAT family N-acetyltransferase [Sulfitobacter mediterraneus]MBM1322625.1 GNAT family N-acetyltransferase [Sulfitobacter mediterraneus]MBM1326537.1 GNAT family N-acetyltransferase [Sulfitobacter mediterraneus]MBM1397883.1 GNAT family N-acetyltransferase [Sulfitobacter mediterraneus]